MAPLPLTGSKARSVAMQFTHVAYGGCWKCLHAWQRWSASTPRRAASQKGFVNSFGAGIGLVTLLQSLMAWQDVAPRRCDMSRDGYLILDSDLHMMEPDDLWARYLDGPHRANLPRFFGGQQQTLAEASD